ncbi:T9SS type A sorting domain-containing protein [Pontimicrobium sp. SW4]|uniref:T9SS type A sorting domain-containing protein n=1 Tax=Pontimicrobium sp. SW4 TaxID=3153519 RepID=A0AAU7BUK8_9FLAO
MKKNYISLILLLFVFTVSAQDYKKMIAAGTYTVQEIQEEAEAYFKIVGTERGKGYKPYKRWEYQALQNMDENGILKTPDFYYKELQDYNRYINQKSSAYRTTVGTWEDLGPTYWNKTSGWNPGVGRITSIAVDQVGAGNPNHIIIGAVSGGVWRTTDRGNTWTVLTDNLTNLNVSALAIHPTNASTYFWGSTGGVIFKSLDSGATWNILADVGNGSVNKILIDPTNTSKMYCSSENGGIFKSTDSGVNWTQIHSEATTGYDVEFKPGNTNVIYATGKQFFKSIDGGSTFTIPQPSLPLWTQENVVGATNWTVGNSNNTGTLSPKTGSSLALFYFPDYSHPVTKLTSQELNLQGATDPKLKFSYTNAQWGSPTFLNELRVYYKTSLVGSWNILATYTNNVTSWSDIELSLPNASSTYYIAFEATNNYGRGTTLDDVSVEDVSLGTVFQDGFELGPNDFGGGPKMMGVSIDDPSVVYVLEASNGIFGGFYRSTDSGETYTKLDHGTNNYFGYSSSANDDRGQAPRDMDIAVNPTNVDEVHIAGILTWKSIDGGDNFNITSQWTLSNAANENIGYCHADVDILEYIDGKLYVGSDGGIFIAEDPSTVNTSYYTDITTGLGIRQFYRIGISQTNPVIVTGGSQDNGTSVMDTSGNWTDWLGADGMESFVDKNNSSILYGTSQNGTLYKSTNGGSTYSWLNRPQDGLGDYKTGNWITPFEQDPLLPGTIYVGYDYVYKSTNGGGTWAEISQDLGGNLNHLKIAPSNSNIMYAADGGVLYKTIDGGATNWITLSGFSGSINSIAIHPTDANRVAIATTDASKVFVSTNGGASWTPYLFDLPNFSARALVWQNNAENGLYLGMNYGVYYIDDSTSNSWQPFSNNLPNVNISELEINTVTNEIYAATYGRGLWKSGLYNPSLNVEEFELNTISLYPNPSSNEVTLSWNKRENVSVKMYNSIGKLIYFAKDRSLIEPLTINISNYESGIYFININTRYGIVTKKLLVN